MCAVRLLSGSHHNKFNLNCPRFPHPRPPRQLQRVIRSALVGDARPAPPAAFWPLDALQSAAAEADAGGAAAADDDAGAAAVAAWRARALLFPGRLVEFRRAGQLDWTPAVVLTKQAWGLGPLSPELQDEVARLPSSGAGLPSPPAARAAAVARGRLLLRRLFEAVRPDGAADGAVVRMSIDEDDDRTQSGLDDVVEALHAARAEYLVKTREAAGGGSGQQRQQQQQQRRQHVSVLRPAAGHSDLGPRAVVCSILRLTDGKVLKLRRSDLGAAPALIRRMLRWTPARRTWTELSALRPVAAAEAAVDGGALSEAQRARAAAQRRLERAAVTESDVARLRRRLARGGGVWAPGRAARKLLDSWQASAAGGGGAAVNDLALPGKAGRGTFRFGASVRLGLRWDSDGEAEGASGGAGRKRKASEGTPSTAQVHLSGFWSGVPV
jgi:hypothetical protein